MVEESPEPVAFPGLTPCAGCPNAEGNGQPAQEGKPVQMRQIPTAQIVVVETVYYRRAGQTSAVDSRFSRNVIGEEQRYVREMKIGREWTSLDCGWVEKAGMLVVKNNLVRFNVLPTAEEKEALGDQILEISFSNRQAEILVYPGESMRIQPINLKDIAVRCGSGKTNITVVIIPG
jgi:hypothetical protein